MYSKSAVTKFRCSNFLWLSRARFNDRDWIGGRWHPTREWAGGGIAHQANSAVSRKLKKPNEVFVEIAALIGCFRFQQGAHAMVSR